MERAAKLLQLGNTDLVFRVDGGKLSVSAAVRQAGESDDAGQFAVLYAEPFGEEGRLQPGQVRSAAASDAVLYLRAPSARLADAVKLMERSGFRYESLMAWPAEPHDLLLVGARGQRPEAAAPVRREEILTIDRKSTRLNSSHIQKSRMPSSA